jgi:hypothetical protein
MFDFAIIAERKNAVVKGSNKKAKKQVVELFSVLPAIDDVDVENKIVSSANPLKTYIDALAKQAETVVFDEPIYNHKYQIIGTHKTYPQREYLEEIIEKVAAYIDDGWDIRLVY